MMITLTNNGTTLLSFTFQGTSHSLQPAATLSYDDEYLDELNELVNGIPDLDITLPLGGVDGDDGAVGPQGPAGADGADYTPIVGLWAARPTLSLVDGMIFFATDENMPYWYNSAGLGTKWFSAAGVEHV